MVPTSKTLGRRCINVMQMFLCLLGLYRTANILKRRKKAHIVGLAQKAKVCLQRATPRKQGPSLVFYPRPIDEYVVPPVTCRGRQITAAIQFLFKLGNMPGVGFHTLAEKKAPVLLPRSFAYRNIVLLSRVVTQLTLWPLSITIVF